MSEPEDTLDQETLLKQVRTLRTIWMAIAQVAILYAGIVWLWLNRDNATRPGNEDAVRVVVYALTGVGVLTSMASFVVRPLLLGPRRIAGALRTDGVLGALRAMTTGFLLTWSLAESCAVMGLVLAFLTGRPFPAYGLIALGFALVFAHPPTTNALNTLLENAERERSRTEAV